LPRSYTVPLNRRVQWTAQLRRVRELHRRGTGADNRGETAHGPDLSLQAPVGAKYRTKGPRRLSILAPGIPLESWPWGIPVIYDARLALARVWQLYRRLVQAPTLPDGFRWRSQPMPAVVKELAGDAGIRIGPQPHRVVTTCPSCRAEVYLLRATPSGWGCRRCIPERLHQLDVSCGGYAMGLAIGLTGRPLVRRRNRLLRRLYAGIQSGRVLDELVTRTSGAWLLSFSPHWQRARPGSRPEGYEPGPLMRQLGPIVVQVAIEELLHPCAFYQRFARRRA
jgi:hypothetical protein